MRIDEQDKVVDSVKIITLMTIPHCVVKASTNRSYNSVQYLVHKI